MLGTRIQHFARSMHGRLIFVHEDAPEVATPLPDSEWRMVRDRVQIERCLRESARTVRAAVVSQLASGRPMETRYDHPILLLQHMIWHEGYHHGQIKLTLKQAGLALDDEAMARDS